MSTAMSAQGLYFKAALLLAILAQSACATSTRPVPVSDATAETTLAVEDFLRWPLQGPDGYDKAVAALLGAYRAQAFSTAPPSLYARNPVRLGDGFSLAGAQVDNQYWYRAVASVSIAEQPCFPMDRATRIAGVQWSPPAPAPAPAGGMGRSFSVEQNGMKLTLTESQDNPQCLADISFLHLATTRRTK